jgi:hypothetical protein
LRDAVEAYREALKEFTEEAAPYQHKIAQNDLDRANTLLAQRRADLENRTLLREILPRDCYRCSTDMNACSLGA